MFSNIEMERKCTFTQGKFKSLNQQNLASCRLSVSTAVNNAHCHPHWVSQGQSCQQSVKERGGASKTIGYWQILRWKESLTVFTCEPTAEHTKFQQIAPYTRPHRQHWLILVSHRAKPRDRNVRKRCKGTEVKVVNIHCVCVQSCLRINLINKKLFGFKSFHLLVYNL